MAALTLFSVGAAQAQLNYQPANASNVVTTYSELGKNATAISMANADDANSTAQNIGFTFSFNGQSFTQFVMNTNGFVRLGSAAPSSAALYATYATGPTDGAVASTNSADANLLMPFNVDLMAGTGTPDYRVRTAGAAGSRVCTIQWKNVADKPRLSGANGTLTPTQYTNMGFQIRLYEGSNTVEFAYAAATVGAVSAVRYVEVGLKGSASGGSNALVTTKTSNNSWSTTTFLSSYLDNRHNVRGVSTTGVYVGAEAGRTYRFVPNKVNDAGVTEIYTMGRLPLGHATSHAVQAIITNTGNGTYTGGTATLTVTGPAGNAFTNTQLVPAMAPGNATTLTFASYTPAVVGLNTVTVNISNDDNNFNNSLARPQEVNRNTYGYAFAETAAYASVGLLNGSGILAVRYTAATSAAIAGVNISMGFDNTLGQTVRAVMLDASGNIMTTSADYVIQTSDFNTVKTFALQTPTTVAAGDDFLVGLAVTPSINAANYYPVNLRREMPTRANTFFTAPLAGGSISDQTSFGVGSYYIEAVTTVQPPFCGQAANLTLNSRTDVSLSFSFATNGFAGNTYTVTLTPTVGSPISQTVSTPSATFTGLPPGTTYTARVVTNCNTSPSSSSLASATATASTLPNLIVSSAQNVSGEYYNVTVTDGGAATIVGDLNVSGVMTVQSGGSLRTDAPTYYVRGTGRFVLDAGATLIETNVPGVANSVSAGFQLTGSPALTLSSDANYLFAGTAAQGSGPLLPAQVRNLTVDNSAGVALTQNLTVAQVLRLQNGNLTLGGRRLLLPSTTTGTALVDNTGGLVLGNTASMQRLLTNTAVNGPAYRHLSSPVSSIAFDSLQTGGFTPIFNSAYNNSATPGTTVPFPTVYGYDQSRLATVTSNYTAFDKGWFTPAGSSSTMQPGKGYTVNAPITAARLRFTGTFNSGTVNSGLLSRGTDASAGWQFLGNPYPSPLDWNTVTTTQRPGMDAAVYVAHSTGQYTVTYSSYTNGIGGGSPVIEPGAGYFVRVTNPNGSGAVNLTNANRITTYGNPQTFGRGTADARPQLRLQLQGSSITDDLYVYLEAGTTAGIDTEFDAVKLLNGTGLNLSTVAGSELLAIDGRPVLTTATVVPLHVGVPAAGTYIFEAAALLNFNGPVYLRDAATGQQIDLRRQPRYTFSTTATTIARRFSLQLGAASAPLATALSFSASDVSVYPNPAHESCTVLLPGVAHASTVRAELLNSLGQVVQRQTAALPTTGTALTVATSSLAAGVYTLRLHAGTATVVKRLIVR